MQLWQCKTNGDICDAFIRSGNHTIGAHRIILVTASGYLRRNLATNLVKLPNGYDFASIELVLQYLYLKKIEGVNKDNIFNLLLVAKLFEVEKLENILVKFLRDDLLNCENCIELHPTVKDLCLGTIARLLNPKLAIGPDQVEAREHRFVREVKLMMDEF
ncbi:hypothetical protein Ciccas_010455 [Cichlidogyrus casuarinus]|uniref:BTB domain-containing protein n=1 Tax=Cichlidogyrus casuarinus TaxID=1844966 RepID=A0ABD2PYP0_9PLAT